jgi:hypothetical protein
MTLSTSVIIVYYVIAAISASCSIFVIATLLKYGMWQTSATKLLLALHSVLLMAEITELPLVFNDIAALCQTIEFLHIFFFLASAITIGLLVVSYRFYFFEDTYSVMKMIDKYWLHLIIIIPTLSLIPFCIASINSEDVVSDANSEWCTINTSGTLLYLVMFIYFYSLIWMILLLSAIVLGYTMYQVYTLDEMVGKQLMNTTGLYSIVSLLSYIPITYVRMSSFSDHNPSSDIWLIAFLPFYSAGILYTMIFLSEKKSLLLFERAITQNRELFSWEISDRVSITSSNSSMLQSSPTMNALQSVTVDL